MAGWTGGGSPFPCRNLGCPDRHWDISIGADLDIFKMIRCPDLILDWFHNGGTLVINQHLTPLAQASFTSVSLNFAHIPELGSLKAQWIHFPLILTWWGWGQTVEPDIWVYPTRPSEPRRLPPLPTASAALQLCRTSLWNTHLSWMKHSVALILYYFKKNVWGVHVKSIINVWGRRTNMFYQTAESVIMIRQQEQEQYAAC